MSEPMKRLDAIVRPSAGASLSATNSPISASASGSSRTAGELTARNLPRASPQTQAAVCPLCGGAGFVVPDVPIGHPEFGKAIPCSCRTEELRTHRQRVLQRLGALDTLARLTFETFTPEPNHLPTDKASNLRIIYQTCVTYAHNPEGWLLLTGTYGCGKTHLAAAIANERLAQGQPAIFMVVPDLLDHLRAAFGPNSEATYDNLFDQLRTAPLLVLDDLGAHSSTPWAQEKLFQLLNYRYNAQLPTVVTTNQRLEELDPRLRSRLLDQGLVTYRHILAPDFRTGKNSGQSELSTLVLHRNQRFDTFDAQRGDLPPAERVELRKALLQCEEYANEPQGWLVIGGVNGCGKDASGRSDCQRICRTYPHRCDVCRRA